MANQLTVLGQGALPANQPGTYELQSGGPSGDGYISQFHGKFYHANRSGHVWIGAPLIAGVTLPVNTSLNAHTMGIINPAASNVLVELISFTFGTQGAAALVVSQILASVTKQVPTSVTVCDNIMNPMAGGGQSLPNATCFKAATVAAAITTHIPMTTSFATSSMTAVQFEFDGKLILPPGWTVSITSSPVQTNASIPCLVWAEHPNV